MYLLWMYVWMKGVFMDGWMYGCMHGWKGV